MTTAQQQIADMLGSSSPVLTAAETRAIATAASRGFLNSTLAVEAASEAVLKAAMEVVRLEQAQTQLTLQEQEAEIKQADLVLRQRQALLQEQEQELKKAELLLRAAQQDNQVEQFLKQLNYNYATLNTTSFHRYASAIQNIMLSTMDEANKTTAINNVLKVFWNDETNGSDVSRSAADIESGFVIQAKVGATAEIEAAQAIVAKFTQARHPNLYEVTRPALTDSSRGGAFIQLSNRISSEYPMRNAYFLMGYSAEVEGLAYPPHLISTTGRFEGVGDGKWLVRSVVDVQLPSGWETAMSDVLTLRCSSENGWEVI